MASCITSSFGSSSCPQVKLEVSISSQTNTKAVLAWALKWVTHGSTVSSSASKAYTVTIDGKTVKSGSFAIGGKSSCTIASGTTEVTKGTSAKSVKFSLSFAMTFTWSGTSGGTRTASGSISVAAKPSYVVKYDANGGAGAPGNQTKSAGASVTISKTAPTRTGYTFIGWATSASATTANSSYKGGSTYSADANLTLYAVWAKITYTITYNANGGSGAPSAQTKTHGTALTLSATKPTKTSYKFNGWAVTSSGSVAYAAGASYTANASITLYAVWEAAYAVPSVSNCSVIRCSETGTPSELGTYAKVSFKWSCNQNIGENPATRVEVWVADPNDQNDAIAYRDYPGTTSGTVSTVIGGNSSGVTTMSFDPDYSYPIYVNVVDSFNGNSYRRIILPSTKFVMDFKAGGTGIAIGKPAEVDNMFDIGLPTRFFLPDTVRFEHSVTGKTLAIGVGSGGTNRGVYDPASKRWLLYTNDTDLMLGAPGYSNWKPYYSAGDSITFDADTAGYLTSSGKQVKFTVTLDKPVLGSPTVSIDSNSLIIVRQAGNYVYGTSSGGTKATDTTNTKAVLTGIGVNCTFAFTTAGTGATNNDSCGIALRSFKLNFT